MEINLKWSKKLPTEPGFYLMKYWDYEHKRWEEDVGIVHPDYHWRTPILKVKSADDIRHYLDDSYLKRFWWAGPIPWPKD